MAQPGGASFFFLTQSLSGLNAAFPSLVSFLFYCFIRKRRNRGKCKANVIYSIIFETERTIEGRERSKITPGLARLGLGRSVVRCIEH